MPSSIGEFPPGFPADDVGPRLKELRTALKLDQEKFGSIFGRSAKRVGRWERTGAGIPLHRLLQTAARTGWGIEMFTQEGRRPAAIIEERRREIKQQVDLPMRIAAGVRTVIAERVRTPGETTDAPQQSPEEVFDDLLNACIDVRVAGMDIDPETAIAYLQILRAAHTTSPTNRQDVT